MTETVTEFDGGPAVVPEFKNLYEAFQSTVARKGDQLAIKSEDEDVELVRAAFTEERMADLADRFRFEG